MRVVLIAPQITVIVIHQEVVKSSQDLRNLTTIPTQETALGPLAKTIRGYREVVKALLDLELYHLPQTMWTEANTKTVEWEFHLATDQYHSWR